MHHTKIWGAMAPWPPLSSGLQCTSCAWSLFGTCTCTCMYCILTNKKPGFYYLSLICTGASIRGFPYTLYGIIFP